jgi:hypothetical protein
MRMRVTWEEFEHNVQRLHDNAQAHGSERHKGPPREGPALLQGLAVCALCGERMSIYPDSLKSREKFLAFCGSEDSDGA